MTTGKNHHSFVAWYDDDNDDNDDYDEEQKNGKIDQNVDLV